MILHSDSLLFAQQFVARAARRVYVPLIVLAGAALARAEPPKFDIERMTIARGYDGKTCWVHARAGAIPGSPPAVVLTMQKLLLTGSDVFYALNDMRSDNLGASWIGPTEHTETLGRRDEPDGVIVAACDFWPKWHEASGKLLGIGHTVRYRDDKVIPVRARETCYSVYDPEKRRWSDWATLSMPDDKRFHNAGAGCTQRVDLPGGDVLLPIYFKPADQKASSVTVVRCRFDGSRLKYVEHGSEHTVDIDRGFAEPSLARYKDRYYLTIRNDRHGYVAASRDGMHFDQPRIWTWDDGSDLGNYNTQQHWVTHSSGLFLVYTRRGANNDHVFRHRAPLFIARVDPEKLHVIRSSERVLVPERGARLGNFGVTDVSERETWVTVTEWMQTWGPNYVMPPDNKYGADNSMYVVRLRWDEPNRSWNKH